MQRDNKGRFIKGHSASNTGKTHFEKGFEPWNKGIKGLNTGKNNPFYGKKHNSQTLQEISKKLKGRKAWNKGKKMKNISGENHYLYKGTTPLNKWIRNRVEYQQWRTKIFERDNYTCQLCNQKGGRLEVDHYPKTFSQLLQENNIKSLEDALNCEALWDTEKNRTLCEICHKATPTWGHRTLFLRREGIFYG